MRAHVLGVLFIGFCGLGSAGAQRIDEHAVVSYPQGSAAIPLLHEIWTFSAATIYPRELAQHFEPRTLMAIESELRSADNTALADALNPFLESLGVSHTRLYDTRHQTYYMLRSLFSTRDLDAPQQYTIGLQLDEVNTGAIRAVMEESPAALVGIRRGDRIVAVDGVPFQSLLQWQRALPTTLTIRGVEGDKNVTLTPILQSFHRALARATSASSKVFQCASRNVGYLHLWSGTHRVFLETLNEAVANAQRLGLDGFVLDLRDGYGGAWWDYLDPFFLNRDDYFQVVTHDARGASEPLPAEPRPNAGAWTGPLAVLVNRGTRSGKEALAHQFKKTGRAMLFGEKTSGAFSGGLGAFADRNDGFVLYLSVVELRLDGLTIEHVGVSPDVAVADGRSNDAPLSAALEHLGCDDGAAIDSI